MECHLAGYASRKSWIIEKASRHYRLFLLSNTNQIHFEKYTRDFKLRYGYDFEDLFEKAYWSFRIHQSKPNPEIFKYVLEDSCLNAAETLFIDDTLENVLSARNAGINSLSFEPERFDRFVRWIGSVKTWFILENKWRKSMWWLNFANMQILINHPVNACLTDS